MTRILNTRPAPMGAELSQQLTELGLISVDYPVILNQATQPDFAQCPQFIDDPDCFWIFISKPSVLFFNQFLTNSGVKAFKPAGKVFAVGKSTALELEKCHFQLKVEAPEEANSEALIAMESLAKAKKVILVKGVGGRGLIQHELSNKGIEVIELDLYEREVQRFTQDELEQWCECKVVLATSVDIAKSILINANNLVNEAKKHEFLQNSRYLVLSERIKAFLIQQNIQQNQIYVCEASDNSSIIKLIKQLAK